MGAILSHAKNIKYINVAFFITLSGFILYYLTALACTVSPDRFEETITAVCQTSTDRANHNTAIPVVLEYHGYGRIVGCVLSLELAGRRQHTRRSRALGSQRGDVVDFVDTTESTAVCPRGDLPCAQWPRCSTAVAAARDEPS